MSKKPTLRDAVQKLEMTNELNTRALNSIDEQLALMSERRREESEELRRGMIELRSTVESLTAEVGALNELMRLIAANQLMTMVDEAD